VSPSRPAIKIVIDLHFLTNVFKKFWFLEILILIIFVIYFHFNPLLTPITSEELGISIENFSTLTLNGLVNNNVDISFDFTQLVSQIYSRSMEILIKRLLKYLFFAELPTQTCLYIFITLILAYIAGKDAKVKYRDFFKFFIFFLSFIILIEFLLILPVIIDVFRFKQILQESLSNETSSPFTNVFKIINKLNSISAYMKNLKYIIGLFVLLFLFFIPYCFPVIQCQGYNLSVFPKAFLISIKNYKYSVIFSLIMGFLFWLSISLPYYLGVIVFCLLLQIFLLVTKFCFRIVCKLESFDLKKL